MRRSASTVAEGRLRSPPAEAKVVDGGDEVATGAELTAVADECAGVVVAGLAEMMELLVQR
uniref:Uncharacterized protein n=1 Tax=Arundo donax TaxID=35708 RepID=A0A0A9C9P6_ARUDO